LSIPERIQLVQDIWDSISAKAGGKVSAEDVLEAERRFENCKADPEKNSVAWEDIQAQWNARR
jgi:putative addiction module component (TIGR02574 family)